MTARSTHVLGACVVTELLQTCYRGLAYAKMLTTHWKRKAKQNSPNS